MFARIALAALAALLSLSSIAEAGEAPRGKVLGLRVGFNGWLFECPAPKKWTKEQAATWENLKSGRVWAVDNVGIVRTVGGESLWYVDMMDTGYGTVGTIFVRLYKDPEDVFIPSVEWDLCDREAEGSRVVSWGTISDSRFEDRFRGGQINVVELVWMDAVNQEQEPPKGGATVAAQHFGLSGEGFSSLKKVSALTTNPPAD